MDKYGRERNADICSPTFARPSAMDECNEYPIAEMSDVYVNIDAIKDAFAAHVQSALKRND